tara:strand:+ start:256 stop:1203 length:948 start_codon:yes stop_codon:yes gene_type:complete
MSIHIDINYVKITLHLENFIINKQKDMIKEERKARWIKTENVTWFCVTSKSSHTPDNLLLFLHGTGGSSECWDELSAELSNRFVTLSLDLPGHGKSQSKKNFKLSLRNIAKELSRLFEFLNIKKIRTIVGHSAGTTLAIELLIYNQEIEVENIIGINPSLIPPPLHFTMALSPLVSPFITSRPTISWLSKIINNSSIINKLLDSTGSDLEDPSKRERYKRLFNNKGHLQGALSFMAETDVLSVLQNVNSVRTKFFFIIGVKDYWIPIDKIKEIFAKYFPGAKVSELDGGHLLNETHSSDLCKLIMTELPERSNGI